MKRLLFLLGAGVVGFVIACSSDKDDVPPTTSSDAGADATVSDADGTPRDSDVDVEADAAPVAIAPFAPDGGDGGDGGTCPEGWYFYSDYARGLFGSDPPKQEGDLLCHRKCKVDTDCGSGFCVVRGLFSGGDYNCNAGVLLCESMKRADDCDRDYRIIP